MAGFQWKPMILKIPPGRYCSIAVDISRRTENHSLLSHGPQAAFVKTWIYHQV